MRRYKTLIISLSIVFGIVAIITILSFTLFGLSTITFDFRNDTQKFVSEESLNNIESSANFKYNECIFFSNKEKYIDSMEINNPYLKVINIETKFPNKYIIHCSEREELFALKVTTQKYFICDNELKLLRILDLGSSDTYLDNYDNQYNPILITGEYTVINLDAKVGEKIILNNSSVLTNICNSMYYNNRDASQQKGFFKSIDIAYNIVGQAKITLTNFNNFNFEIIDGENYLTEKVQILFSAYDKVSPSYYNAKKLLIFKNADNKFVAQLTEK